MQSSRRNTSLDYAFFRPDQSSFQPIQQPIGQNTRQSKTKFQEEFDQQNRMNDIITEPVVVPWTLGCGQDTRHMNKESVKK